MTTRLRLLISCLLVSLLAASQNNFTGVYKIDGLLKRIASPDTIYVVNFWATWCKPCVEELPAFDSLAALKTKAPLKVLLVSLDFKEDLDKKVKPFLIKRGIKSECVLLDEINGNDFINKIDPAWSGAIPATLFHHSTKKEFVEKKLRLSELEAHVRNLE